MSKKWISHVATADGYGECVCGYALTMTQFMDYTHKQPEGCTILTARLQTPGALTGALCGHFEGHAKRKGCKSYDIHIVVAK